MSKLENYLDKHGITIFSKTYNAQCEKMKQLIGNLHLKKKVYEVDLNEVSNDIIKELHTKTGYKQYPNVFIGMKNVKGILDVETLIETGEWHTLVKQHQIKYIE